MAAQVTDGNPDCSDLSDENRPEKLDERLSELYDNRYTNVQNILEEKFQHSFREEDFAKKNRSFLLNILYVRLHKVFFYIPIFVMRSFLD